MFFFLAPSAAQIAQARRHFSIPGFYSRPNSDNHFNTGGKPSRLAQDFVLVMCCNKSVRLRSRMGANRAEVRLNGINADWNPVIPLGQPTEGDRVRSRLWLLILRELPSPLRWLGTELVRFIQWIDASTFRFFKGLRESPAWYFVTSIGLFAVFLTFMMFISLINETSGHRSASAARIKKESFTREDLERNHDWAVQDRWRVAHLFVNDKPAPKPHDLTIDSRLMASNFPKSKVTRPTANARSRQPSTYRSKTTDEIMDVRLDLSRPKIAQQGNRLVRGTVLNPNAMPDRPSGNRPQRRDPRLLVQASWNFGSDCQSIDPVEWTARPSTRKTLPPIPEPELDLPRRLPRSVPRQESPQFSFEMAMVRHFSVAGDFPPGSHRVNQSLGLVFPENGRPFPSELVSHQESPWKPYHVRQTRSSPEVIPYHGDGVYEPSTFGNQILDEFDPTLQAVADVALQLKLNTPDHVTPGTLHESKLVVTNRGADSVSRIEFKDYVSHLPTVVAANPPAMGERIIDPETGNPENILHREIANLHPGDSREMSLKWIPTGRSHQFHRVYVISHAEVSVATDVIQADVVQQMPSIPPEPLKHHSALACDIQHLDRVTVGDELELEITVRNTGDTKLHQVKVQIVIPDQFSHRDGKTLVFDAGNLPVSGQNRTVVKLSARDAGDAVHVIRVNSEESVEAHGRMTVQVVERRKERELSISPLDTKRAEIPATTTNNAFSRSAPVSARAIPVGECCCQKAVSPGFTSYVIVPE